ncbi:MAG TPA: hypothetical protein VIN08_13360 [Ohtaekwangia sp.]|uniref:hypothetical protein n=1 Tax=Ohtaekwangia sp. TaxID=2066019 RepID=UPI002F93C9E6
MFRTGLGIAFFLMGCIVKNNNTGVVDMQNNSKYFSDIDLFQMKGVDELYLESSNQPHVRIDSIGKNQRDVVFSFDGKTVYKKNYQYDGHCWTFSHHVNDHNEGSVFYFYEFVCTDSIVELEYKGDPFKGGTLETVRKTTHDGVWEYDFEDDAVKVKPRYDVEVYHLGKLIRKRISMYQIKDGILTLHKKTINGATDRMERESVDCYVVGKFSFFWWTIVGYRFEKIDC